MPTYSKSDRLKYPRRVIHLASGDLWAGAEVQLYHLACHLQNSAEIELLVVLLNRGELEKRLTAAGVSVKILEESRYGFMRLLVMLLCVGRKFRPDVIHTHRHKENLLGSLASILLPGCSSLRTVHGADEHRPRWWQLVQILRRILDRWAGRWLQTDVVCVSTELKQTLLANYPAQKLTVVANGVDALAVQAQAQGEDLALPLNRIKVAFIGRMVAVKRIDLFVKIAALAEQQFPDQYQFYAIGDGPLMEAARHQATLAGLNNLVFTGFRKDSPRWLAAMDRLLIVSDHEGLPMVLLEAMALRVPVIARRVGGISHVLGDGIAGVMVDSADPQQLLNSLTKVHDGSRLDQQLDAASNRLDQQFSAQAMARQYEALYLKAQTNNRSNSGKRTASTGAH